MGLVMGRDGQVHLVPDAQPLPQLPNIPGGPGGIGGAGGQVLERAVAMPPTLVPHLLDYFAKIAQPSSPFGGGGLGGAGNRPMVGAPPLPDLSQVANPMPLRGVTVAGAGDAPSQGGLLERYMNSAQPQMGSLGLDGSFVPPPAGPKTIGDITNGKPVETRVDSDLEAPPGVTADSLDDYLHKTPLAGHGAAFMQAGQQYDIDPRAMIGIASVESSVGRAMPKGSNNPFGLKDRGNIISYPDVESAINALGHSLRNTKNNYDLSNADKLYGIYCNPKDGQECEPGRALLNQRIQEQNGDPQTLTYWRPKRR